jgi:hypothetical protein
MKKLCELVIAFGIGCMALSNQCKLLNNDMAYHLKNDTLMSDIAKINGSAKKSYTVLVDNGGLNPQEGAGVDLVKNGDTLNMRTNYIGMLSFYANSGDTLVVYPTEKSSPFNKTNYILGEKTFNVIDVYNKVELSTNLTGAK